MISILKIEKQQNNFLNLFLLRNKDNCKVELSSECKNDTSDNIEKKAVHNTAYNSPITNDQFCSYNSR